jgi:hypothetical protein
MATYLFTSLRPGFNSRTMNLPDYNFVSVHCEKSASSLTFPNTVCFSRFSRFLLQ